MPLRVCAGAVFFITCPVVRRTAFGTNHDVLSVLELLVTDRALVTLVIHAGSPFQSLGIRFIPYYYNKRRQKLQ